jgi:uncharacterized membrane protein YGL010W
VVYFANWIINKFEGVKVSQWLVDTLTFVIIGWNVIHNIGHGVMVTKFLITSDVVMNVIILMFPCL